MLEEVLSQVFWVGLLKIIGVNIILSGDNAVVRPRRALAAPAADAGHLWGARRCDARDPDDLRRGALALPWLKLVGSLSLLDRREAADPRGRRREHPGERPADRRDQTILIADLR
jgi:hypothetical protein